MRRVLITGGASGIGAACVRRFRGDGCSVAVLDCDQSALVASPAEFGTTCDVGDADSLAAAVDEAAAALGGLDVVVAAAGIAGRGTVADTAPADWDRVLAVNLRGVYLTGRAAIPHLRAAGGGAIVNIASQLGLVGAASAAAYCASKGAVVSLTRAMAIDHGPEGIRVNCVCPGLIDTPMSDAANAALGARRGVPVATIVAERAAAIPAGRPGTPDEVAGTVAFLLSDDAAYVTGTTVTVAGGALAGLV
jgi:NAD(P)-dependent dehydrogenase (short-subunit alcohol dehydrogenase family)